MSTARRTGAAGRIDPDLRAEFEAIADSMGCELVEAESKGGTLRLFIDRPDGGVTLADCERMSRLVSALLDVVDFGRDRYVLEVSSPGLDRQLYRPRDYERFTGHRVRVTFLEPDGGGKRTVTGRLEEFRPEDTAGGRIQVVTDDDERLELSLEQVQVARLEIEF